MLNSKVNRLWPLFPVNAAINNLLMIGLGIFVINVVIEYAQTAFTIILGSMDMGDLNAANA